MAAKISPNKLSRLFELYLSGLNQWQVAQQLNIDQSTVSLCLARFNKRSEVYGLENAAKEIFIMDSIYTLHSLAVELKSNKLSVEEARQGIKVRDKLAQYGVHEGDYKELVLAVGQLYEGGFLKAATRLVALEGKTGMDYVGVIDKFEKVMSQIAAGGKELEQLEAAIKKAKEERASAEISRSAAETEFSQYLAGTTVTLKRLKAVEQLAALLRQGHVWDEELAGYVKRQEELNKSGISIELFGKIVSEIAPLVMPDGGKKLLEVVAKYGSLQKAVAGLQQKKYELKGISETLAEKTTQHKALSDLVNNLTVKRDRLADVVEAYSLIAQQVDQLKETVAALETARRYHEGGIKTLEDRRDWLSGKVEDIEAHISELEPLERKHSDLVSIVAELEKRGSELAREMEILHAFLGYMKNITPEALNKFISTVPLMLSYAKSKQDPPELLRKMILNDLTMGQMNIYVCQICGTRFFVDRAPRPKTDFTCPNCNTPSVVRVETDAEDALRNAGTIEIADKNPR
jgi:DNA-directed RNA polymerase subunit RPC12/RpoP